MKISTTKEQLVHAISLAERITGKKESLPILSCVLLDARDKHLHVRATNLEAGIELTIPATIDSEGTIAVPAGILSQIIRTTPTEAVSLKEQDGNLALEGRG